MLEIDLEGVVEEDHDEPQEMGDDSKEITDEMLDVSSEKRSEALSAFSEGYHVELLFLNFLNFPACHLLALMLHKILFSS